MYKYSFDNLNLAVAVSKSELDGLMTGRQTAVLKNTRTSFKGGLKCYLYETKSGGGRGSFVAIGELERATFYSSADGMYNDCGMTQEEAEKKITYRHGGIIFYIKNVVMVEDPETLSQDIRLQFLIDPPKTVTLMKK